MKHSHIPLLDYTDIEEEQCHIYVHTKDKRMLVFKDIQSNPYIDEIGFYVDYIFLSRRMSVFIPREDFSHVEYWYSTRENITKKDFDELHSFIDDQIEVLREP